MSILSKEIRVVQNPALGAFLIWRFSVGYELSSENQEFTPLPLTYIVLPILLHPQICEYVQKTREASGLRKFAGKFAESKASKRDLLLSVNKRALKMRYLTTQSVNLAISTHLVSLIRYEGRIISLSTTPPKFGIPNSIKPLLKSAEKLGVWCSQVSLHEVSIVLKVGF